jgi:hypothetical protein
MGQDGPLAAHAIESCPPIPSFDFGILYGATVFVVTSRGERRKTRKK